MSMRGGYQIIDLDNFKFSSSDENSNIYRNMYYNLLNSNAKLILLSGLYMDNSQYSDMDVIFYETDMEDEYPTFQAVLRITWNTTAHTCTTRYVNIASNNTGEKNSWKDAKVWLSANTIIYEDVDQALNILSSKAIANKVVTENINRLDAEDKTFLKLDGSREMTGPLTIIGQRPKLADIMIKNGKSFKVTSDTGSYLIFDGVNNPTSEYHGANKKYVDDSVKSINDLFWSVTCDAKDNNSKNSSGRIIRSNNILMISLTGNAEINPNGTLTITFSGKTLPDVESCPVNIQATPQPPGTTNDAWYSCYMSGSISNNIITLSEGAGGSITSTGGVAMEIIVGLPI